MGKSRDIRFREVSLYVPHCIKYRDVSSLRKTFRKYCACPVESLSPFPACGLVSFRKIVHAKICVNNTTGPAYHGPMYSFAQEKYLTVCRPNMLCDYMLAAYAWSDSGELSLRLATGRDRKLFARKGENPKPEVS